MKKNVLRNQKGFTLIEIIAVLVILGILAAIAIPRYMDLQEEANRKALDGAVADGMSTCSMQFGQLALSLASAPTVAQVVSAATANPPQSTDFSYVFAVGAGSSVDVTVNWSLPKTGISPVVKNWRMP